MWCRAYYDVALWRHCWHHAILWLSSEVTYCFRDGIGNTVERSKVYRECYTNLYRRDSCAHAWVCVRRFFITALTGCTQGIDVCDCHAWSDALNSHTHARERSKENTQPYTCACTCCLVVHMYVYVLQEFRLLVTSIFSFVTYRVKYIILTLIVFISAGPEFTCCLWGSKKSL